MKIKKENVCANKLKNLKLNLRVLCNTKKDKLKKSNRNKVRFEQLHSKWLNGQFFIENLSKSVKPTIQKQKNSPSILGRPEAL